MWSEGTTYKSIGLLNGKEGFQIIKIEIGYAIIGHVDVFRTIELGSKAVCSFAIYLFCALMVMDKAISTRLTRTFVAGLFISVECRII